MTDGVLLSECDEEPQDEFYGDVEACVERLREHNMDHKTLGLLTVIRESALVAKMSTRPLLTL